MSIIHEFNITDRLGIEHGLPRELELNVAPKAIAASNKIVSVFPQTSSSVGPVQTVQFLIPQSTGMMRAHSAFLKFDLNVTSPSAWSFSGSAQSAAALINTLQLSAGGTVIENLLNYHIFHNNIVLAHGSPAETLNTESICAGSFPANAFGSNTHASVDITGSALLSNANANYPLDSTGNTYKWTFTVPLYLGALNNENSTALPLFAMNGGMVITIQTNPITKAFYAASTGPSTYTMSNLEFQYVEIEPSMEYRQSVLEGLRGGKLIKIECPSYLNTILGGNSSVRQNFNLNMASLDAVIWGLVQQTDAVTNSKYFVCASGNTIALDPTTIRREIFLDNRAIYNSPFQLNLDSVNYRLLQQAIANVSDHAISPFVSSLGVVNGVANNGSYRNQAYALGVPTRNFVSEDVSLAGCPVNTLSVSLQDPNVQTTDTYYFYFMHTYLLVIDGNLAVSKIM